MRPFLRRGRALLVLTSLVVAGMTVFALPSSASTKPEFRMPFACGEQWAGSTRSSHSPSVWSVDWNRDAYDEGHTVVATAPGIVTSVVDLGGASYGLYVVIDHGDGWTTLHAHLLDAFVVVGQSVDEGQVIALLGTSGNSTGPHLHYEQRLDRVDQHASFDGTPFVYDTWQKSVNCGDSPVVGDWDSDGHTDLGIFARRPASGVFRELRADGVRRVSFGVATNTPLTGDWNGNGRADLGVWMAAHRRFALRTGAGIESFTLGHRGDLPVTGDWNGDGVTDAGAFHPASGSFRLRMSPGVVAMQFLGGPSSLPVAGDWDGDGRSQVGVYDQATSTFTLLMADGSTKVIRFGAAGSLPVIGTWNRDRISDVGVWDSSQRLFSLRYGPRHTETIPFGHRR